VARRSIRVPLPGRPVRGSRTGRPVMALLDLLGRRWVLRILWELREEPAATFRDLQARCGNVSSSVLNQRLRELREAGILATGDPNGYELTEAGRSLLRARPDRRLGHALEPAGAERELTASPLANWGVWAIADSVTSESGYGNIGQPDR
jgi:DNA-binding HxlR family transcriptional regulator